MQLNQRLHKELKVTYLYYLLYYPLYHYFYHYLYIFFIIIFVTLIIIQRPYNMPSYRPKKKKTSQPKSNIIALKESANLKSLFKQALLCLATNTPSKEAPFNKQPITNSLPKDLQLAKDLIISLPTNEISKDSLALRNPSKN
jgi:hypothetical protein